VRPGSGFWGPSVGPWLAIGTRRALTSTTMAHWQQDDWQAIFSAPLNPTVFAALDANGVLGPPPQRPQGYAYPPQGLPPSLWMSPAVPRPEVHSPTSPVSDGKSTLFSDIFSDDLFTQQPPLSPQPTSPFTSPRVSGSPDLKASPDPEIDPEQLAKEDPLATQVWKMYARTKVTLPHAQRMENITWRMMALALKKKKEDEAAAAAAAAASPVLKSSPKSPHLSPPSAEAADRISQSLPHQPFFQPDERGRRIDKGKARVRVVGFDGIQQDGPDDEPEYVAPTSRPPMPL